MNLFQVTAQVYIANFSEFEKHSTTGPVSTIRGTETDLVPTPDKSHGLSHVSRD